MKRLLLLILLTVLVACKPSGPDGMPDNSQSNTKIDRSNVLSDLTSITAELGVYYLQHNKYPTKLEDLKLKLYHPNDLIYDAKKGQVRSKSFPEL